MKKTVCTIITNNKDETFCKLLKNNNIHYVEIVPTDLDDSVFLNSLKNNNIKISSIQGLLYGLTGSISDETTWSSCFNRIQDIRKKSSEHNVKYFVFGSPSWRKVPVKEDLLIKFLLELSALEIDLGIKICFENCCSQYGSNILNTYNQVETICSQLNLSYMLDRSSFIAEKENKIQTEPMHFHVSEFNFLSCPESLEHIFKFNTTEYCGLECKLSKNIVQDIELFGKLIV